MKAREHTVRAWERAIFRELEALRAEQRALSSRRPRNRRRERARREARGLFRDEAIDEALRAA